MRRLQQRVAPLYILWGATDLKNLLLGALLFVQSYLGKQATNVEHAIEISYSTVAKTTSVTVNKQAEEATNPGTRSGVTCRNSPKSQTRLETRDMEHLVEAQTGQISWLVIS
jgi:hypothetical protein